MNTNTGGQAFPQPVAVSPAGDEHIAYPGMTLRAYIAVQAMQAMITKSSGQDATGGKEGVPLIAKYAVEYADALIAELEES